MIHTGKILAAQIHESELRSYVFFILLRNFSYFCKIYYGKHYACISYSRLAGRKHGSTASQAKWNAVKTGAIGAAKIGGAAAVAGGLGFGKLAYDKVTGQDVNNSSY